MKKKAITAAAIALLVPLAAVFVGVPSSVPPGQPPLTTLSSVSPGEFEAAFDADPSVPRLLLLLSPT